MHLWLFKTIAISDHLASERRKPTSPAKMTEAGGKISFGQSYWIFSAPAHMVYKQKKKTHSPTVSTRTHHQLSDTAANGRNRRESGAEVKWAAVSWPGR